MSSKITQTLEKFGFGFYYWFRKVRQPITTPICRLFIQLHINPTHLTLSRVLILIGLFFFWLAGFYLISIILLTLNLFLDGVDGDLARMLGQDSDLGAFEDTMTDTLMVIILPLCLISQGLIPGLLGAYYIFITTISWWLSMLRGTETKKTDWIFKPETTPIVHVCRLWVVTILIYLYVIFKTDIFFIAISVISVVLTLYSALDYGHIIKTRHREWPTK